MGFAISRTMRWSDYQELHWESNYVDIVQQMAGPRHSHQHQHRQWEYAMMLHAYGRWFWDHGRSGRLMVGDFGCGVGLSPSIMMSIGNHVTCYEPWVRGNEEKFQLDALASTQRKLDHERYDVALCISTLGHISEYQQAWIDLLKTVRPGGLVFITTDFAEDEEDHYQLAYLRAGKMFTSKTYSELMDVAYDMGFTLHNGDMDYSWSEENRLVNDYGFASLAMVRNEN